MGMPIDEEWLREHGVDQWQLDQAKGNAPASCAAVAQTGPWEIAIPGWSPTPLNKLLGVHWGTRSKRKRGDRETVSRAVAQLGVPPAQGKRRVSLRITLPKGKRRTDPDSLWKTLLDAAKHAKLIRDDTADLVEMGTVAYERGENLKTIILIEDV